MINSSFSPVMLNSLLALLNSRESLRDKLEGNGILSIHLSQLPSTMGLGGPEVTVEPKFES